MEVCVDINDALKALIRIGLIAIAGASALVSRWVFISLGNERVNYLAKRAFLGFLFFAIARAIAALIDTRLDFEIAWFTTLVTYAFNGSILWVLVKLYLKLQEEQFEIHRTGDDPRLNPDWIDRARLSDLLDDVLDEAKILRRKTNKLATDLGA